MLHDSSSSAAPSPAASPPPAPSAPSRKRARTPPPVAPPRTLRVRLAPYGPVTRPLDAAWTADPALDLAAALAAAAADDDPAAAAGRWLAGATDGTGATTTVFAELWAHWRPPLAAVWTEGFRVQAAAAARLARDGLAPLAHWPVIIGRGLPPPADVDADADDDDAALLLWPRDDPRVAVAVADAVARVSDCAQPAAVLCAPPTAPAVAGLWAHCRRLLDPAAHGRPLPPPAADADADAAERLGLPPTWAVRWFPAGPCWLLHRVAAADGDNDDDADDPAPPPPAAGLRLPRGARNVPTAEEVRRAPPGSCLGAVRAAALGDEAGLLPDLYHDMAWRLNLGALRTDPAAAPASARALERSVALLAYWLAAPSLQPPTLFAAARDAAALPADAADRHLPPLLA